METVFFIGAKSGGHINPLISYNKKMRNENFLKKYRSIFLTSTSNLDKKIIEFEKNDDENFIDEYFQMKYSKIGFFPKDIFYFLNDFFSSIYYIVKYKPVAIYTTGGIVSLIITFIAFLFKIPTYIFHLDSVPGKAGKIISFWAKENWVTFEVLKKEFKNSYKKDYPIKFSKDSLISKFEACKKLKIPFEKKIIFVTGGSQGSEEINDLIISFFKNNSSEENKKIYCIHQVGKGFKDEIEKFYRENFIDSTVFEYEKDLSNFYCASDLIVGRAGAGTLFEINFFDKKSLIIPLRNVANNHQVENAKNFKNENKKTIILFQKNEEDFFKKMNSLLNQI